MDTYRDNLESGKQGQESESIDAGPDFIDFKDLAQKLKSGGAEVKIFDSVKFSLKEKRRRKHTGERELMMVSLNHLNETQRKKVLAAFDEFRSSLISFPIKERSKHLMIRFQQHIYNFGYWPIPWVSQFRVWPSTLPSRATIETLTFLTPNEKQGLSHYIKNIRKHKRKTLGGFNNDGYQKTNNTLINNRTKKRGHNCTSWIATAPISENGKSFMEALGANRDFNIGTNPGWWSSWLLSLSQRQTKAIYWDTIPLGEMEERIGPEGYFEWDFKRL